MLKSIGLLRNFLRNPCSQRILLMEAVLCLLLARGALRLLPFRCIAGFLNRPVPKPEVAGAMRVQLRREVSWAIDRAAMCLPGETVCLPRGLVAQAMLRRRKVGTTLYYGAATLPGRGLAAHVWVLDGKEGVVGNKVAIKYHVFARYPEEVETVEFHQGG